MPCRRKHVHFFNGVTTRNRQHRHLFGALTEANMMPMSDGRHRHRYSTRTDQVLDHTHHLGRLSGPNINIGNGQHIHRGRGMTSRNRDHRHRYRFTTRRNMPI